MTSAIAWSCCASSWDSVRDDRSRLRSIPQSGSRTVRSWAGAGSLTMLLTSMFRTSSSKFCASPGSGFRGGSSSGSSSSSEGSPSPVQSRSLPSAFQEALRVDWSWASIAHFLRGPREVESPSQHSPCPSLDSAPSRSPLLEFGDPFPPFSASLAYCMRFSPDAVSKGRSIGRLVALC